MKWTRKSSHIGFSNGWSLYIAHLSIARVYWYVGKECPHATCVLPSSFSNNTSQFLLVSERTVDSFYDFIEIENFKLKDSKSVAGVHANWKNENPGIVAGVHANGKNGNCRTPEYICRPPRPSRRPHPSTRAFVAETLRAIAIAEREREREPPHPEFADAAGDFISPPFHTHRDVDSQHRCYSWTTVWVRLLAIAIVQLLVCSIYVRIGLW